MVAQKSYITLIRLTLLGALVLGEGSRDIKVELGG